MSRSFVDLMFILLCAVISLVAQATNLRSLRIDPADAGTGGTRAVAGSSIEVVAVSDEALDFRGQRLTSADEVRAASDPDMLLLLVPEHERVSHHRVLALWRDLTRLGLRVELGVKAKSGGSPS
jgi:hypothetical protein